MNPPIKLLSKLHPLSLVQKYSCPRAVSFNTQTHTRAHTQTQTHTHTHTHARNRDKNRGDGNIQWEEIEFNNYENIVMETSKNSTSPIVFSLSLFLFFSLSSSFFIEYNPYKVLLVLLINIRKKIYVKNISLDVFNL